MLPAHKEFPVEREAHGLHGMTSWRARAPHSAVNSSHVPQILKSRTSPHPPLAALTLMWCVEPKCLAPSAFRRCAKGGEMNYRMGGKPSFWHFIISPWSRWDSLSLSPSLSLSLSLSLPLSVSFTCPVQREYRLLRQKHSACQTARINWGIPGLWCFCKCFLRSSSFKSWGHIIWANSS